jgi:hypothetical protein
MKAALEENRDVLNGQLVRDVQQTLRDADWNLNDLPKFLKNIIQQEAWKRRVLPNPLPGESHVEFQSFRRFVTDPLIKGLGTTVDHLKNICRDDDEAQDLIDHALQEKPGKRKKDISNNVTNIGHPHGNSQAKGLRRLRKSRPDLHAKVLAGELSVHSAMIEAGFRERKVEIPLDPERAAGLIKKHFNEDQIVELIDYLVTKMTKARSA